MPVPIKVGIFQLELVGTTSNGLRWKVFNTAVKITHHTYGSEEEVMEAARVQDEAWGRKLSGMKRVGSAWRATNMPTPKAKNV